MTQSFLQSEDELSNVLFHFLPEATRESINATRNASHARLLEHLRGEVLHSVNTFSKNDAYHNGFYDAQQQVIALLSNNE